MADKRTYEVKTGFPVDFKNGWGLERVVLEAVSNQLPSGSQGKTTSVRVKQSGKYVDFRFADPNVEVEEIQIEDDGKGYDPRLLSTLLSFNRNNLQSVGQFGEGLKGVSTISLRNNLTIQFRSRNWTADPYTVPEVIDGVTKDMLAFKITENGEQINGSRTIFIKPPKDLVKEILNLPKNVLYFNDQYVELHNEKDNIKDPLYEYLGGSSSKIRIDPNIFRNFNFREESGSMSLVAFKNIDSSKLLHKNSGPKYNSRIIDLKNGQTVLYVKNVRVKGMTSLYSYDLGIEEISSDRNFVDFDILKSEVRGLLEGCTNTEVIENVIKAAEEKKDNALIELQAFRPQISPEEFGNTFRIKEIWNLGEPLEEKIGIIGKLICSEDLWVKSFKKLYGENAVLHSRNSFANGDAEIMGYKVVELDSGLANYLRSKGIQSADKIKVNQEYRFVDDLTPEEIQILSEGPSLDDYLAVPQDKRIEVRVYSGLFTDTGREIVTSLGVHIKTKDGENYMGIKRDTLKDRKTFVETYLHERGHEVTGAPDEDRSFTGYFTNNLARHYIESHPRGKK